METWITAVSALVALVLSGVSLFYSRRSIDLAARSAEQSHSLAERTAEQMYLERVRDWADSALVMVVALERMCREDYPQEGFTIERDSLRTSLSAQIEKGRWFFPNTLTERVGQRKEAAYRGHRQPILDYLVEAYRETKDLTWDGRAESREKLVAARRAFVSEVQASMDPQRRETAYKSLLKRYDDLEQHVDQW